MEIDIDSSVRKIVYDADMVTTIIDNLMSNALKYTPSGLIRLSLHYVDTDGVEYAEIKVADTGYGISANGLKHIYERYYQVEGEHQASGTGIGLALVKNLVELHQGTIDVVSEEGKGTTFTFRLRADNTYPEALHDDSNQEARHHYPAAPDNESRAHDAPEAESSGALHILVVEDNADIRDYIEQSLCDEFAIATAANGWEALKAIADNAPDIVVSDIMMPEMDGITLCRRLKEDMLTSHIPVILLTAKDAIDDKQLGYEAGADSYITKPFSVKMLRSRIHNIIEARRRLAARFMALPAAMESTKNQSPASEAADETSQSFPESQTMVETEKKVDNPITQLNPLDQRFMENVNQLIEDNIDNEELGVAFIADRMCMSKPTLYRKMMAIVGVTTNEYLRHMRLMKSIELYQTGLYNITQLAELTGFGMRSSYSKAFKKEFGVSPKEYFNLHFPHSPHINDDE